MSYEREYKTNSNSKVSEPGLQSNSSVQLWSEGQASHYDQESRWKLSGKNDDMFTVQNHRSYHWKAEGGARIRSDTDYKLRKDSAMIYLQSFQMPTRVDEENYFANPLNFKAKRTCYTTKYPFDLFRYRELPEFYFTDITIFINEQIDFSGKKDWEISNCNHFWGEDVSEWGMKGRTWILYFCTFLSIFSILLCAGK